MRPKTLVIMGAAIACGLAASFMTAHLLKDQKVPVLVAQQDIPRGTPLANHDALFRLEERSRHEVPPGSASLDQLKPKAHDHVIKNSLKPGDVLAIDNVVDRKEIGLVYTLKHGFTAMSVRATPESSFAGLIEPGNHVKIITLKKAVGAEKRSMILMKNIRVLAVDSMLDKTMDKKIPSIITLEVNDDEAKKLRLAQEDGPLTLGLTRGDPGDRKGEEEEPVQPAEDVRLQRVKVLVARQPIPRNTIVKDPASLFVVKEVLKLQLPAHYVATLEELAGISADHTVLKPMRADEPLSLDYLGKADQPPPASGGLLTIVEGSRQRTYQRQPGGKVVLIDSLDLAGETRTPPRPMPPAPAPAAVQPPAVPPQPAVPPAN